MVAEAPEEAILFVGTYTKKEGHVDGQGEGIYVYAMNKETGALSYRNTSDPIISPSYLAVHPNGQHVYAVNEFDGGEEAFATLTALSYDPTDHSLSWLNEVSSLGQYPCHISIDNTGRFVMTANYVGGSVALYPILEGGLLDEYSSYKKHEGSSDHPRQEAAHAHQIIQHPRLGYVTAVDLGADKLYEYQLDTLSQTLDFVREYPNGPKMGGPRHIAFHPTLNVSYTLNELIGSIEVTELQDSLKYFGNMQVISTQEMNDTRDAASAAIKIHPNGKFLYASNRGELNDIAMFAIGERGELTPIGRQSTLGLTPRDFEIDPSGKFLLAGNQDSNTIVTFAIDQETGLLSETGYVAEVPTPVCIKFLDE
jgi:6-phosphogluconolactonase